MLLAYGSTVLFSPMLLFIFVMLLLHTQFARLLYVLSNHDMVSSCDPDRDQSRELSADAALPYTGMFAGIAYMRNVSRKLQHESSMHAIEIVTSVGFGCGTKREATCD